MRTTEHILNNKYLCEFYRQVFHYYEIPENYKYFHMFMYEIFDDRIFDSSIIECIEDVITDYPILRKICDDYNDIICYGDFYSQTHTTFLAMQKVDILLRKEKLKILMK